MFRILFDLPRSSVLNKDLLLHVNPYNTLKNVHTKGMRFEYPAKLCLVFKPPFEYWSSEY